MEDLEEVIRVTRQAIEVTPEDHPDLAAYLTNLGCQFLSLDSASKLDTLKVLLQAWNCSNAIPFVPYRGL